MIKKTGILCIVFLTLAFVLTACGKTPKQEVKEPDNASNMAAYTTFTEYTRNLQYAAGAAYKRVQEQLSHEAVMVDGQVVRPGLDEAFINNVLADLRAKAPITSWCWQNAQGVVMYSDLAHTIGLQGGAEDIVDVAYQNNVVYASNNVVKRQEAARALVIVIPMVAQNQIYGAFVGVVTPEQDLVNLMEPYVEFPRGLVLMNLQGGVILSDNLDEIGRNYLTDEYYKPFGDLLLVVSKMRSQESGIARYYFFVGNTPYKDWYNVNWASVRYFSHTWRFAVREPVKLDLQTTY